jgi:hypothetical protein
VKNYCGTIGADQKEARLMNTLAARAIEKQQGGCKRKEPKPEPEPEPEHVALHVSIHRRRKRTLEYGLTAIGSFLVFLSCYLIAALSRKLFTVQASTIDTYQKIYVVITM